MRCNMTETPADQAYIAAMATFAAWVAENDQDGEMTLLQQITAYGAAGGEKDAA